MPDAWPGGRDQPGDQQRGAADEVANGKECDAVAYESDVPGIGVEFDWDKLAPLEA